MKIYSAYFVNKQGVLAYSGKATQDFHSREDLNKGDREREVLAVNPHGFLHGKSIETTNQGFCLEVDNCLRTFYILIN